MRIVAAGALMGLTGPQGAPGNTGPAGPPGPGTGAGAWQPSTAYTASQVVQAPDGSIIQRNSSGTSRASFDSTEKAAWTAIEAAPGTMSQQAVSAASSSSRTAKTAAYTAARGDLVACDTTGGTFAVTLPAASSGKGTIKVKWVAGTAGPTIALTGGDHLNTSTGPTSGTFTLLNECFVFESDGSGIWTVTSDDIPLSQLDTRYLQPSQVAPISQAGQTPSQLPVAPGVPSVGSLAVAARADHIHPSFGLLAMWAVGGASSSTVVSPQTQSSARTSVTFDGTTAVSGFSLNTGTKTYTAQGGAQWVMSAVNITINATVTVINGLFPFFCSGTFTNNGTLQVDGGNASGFTGGSTPNGATYWLGTGANGGNGGTTNGSNAGGCVGGNGGTVSIAGNGGASGSNTGGNNTTANLMHADVQAGLYNPWCLFNGLYYTNQANLIAFPGGGGGGGGAGDGTNKGGGGGAGGGVVIVNAKVFAGSGTISAKGGNGAAGAGGNAGGGGAGSGGLVIVNTLDASGWTGTLTAAGGSPGAGSGTGSAGGVQASFGAGWTQLNVWQ